jgi:hypothetical protein
MRIAVCFSGLIRTGVNCADNIKRFFGDMLPYCDFFLHTWDYEPVKPFFRSHWNGIPFIQRHDDILCNIKLQKFIDAFNIKSYKVDSYSDFIENIVNNNNNKFPVVWHTMSRSFDLKKQYEQCNDFKYDVVIKIRPDVIFPARKTLKEELRSIDLSKPVIYSDPHVETRLDDVFWITNTDVANVVIEMPYIEINQTSVNINFIVLDFLKKNGIIHKPLSKFRPCYTIYRYESYMFDPMYNFRGCFINDIIHYSCQSEEEIKQVIRRIGGNLGDY